MVDEVAPRLHAATSSPDQTHRFDVDANPRYTVSMMLASRSEEYIEGPRHAVVTSDDNGAVLQIVTYFLIVVVAMATLLRLFLRVNVAHAAGPDDGLACLALVSTLPLLTVRSVC